jgi:rhodanese-related sulfurtransferase
MATGTSVTKGFRQLVAEANAQVESLTAAEAMQRLSDSDVTLVDIRDLPELERDGMIPGAIHASRGMLEFYVDPDGPYHKPELLAGGSVLLYCASGGRSALAAQRLQEMGITSVAHIAGGIRAWVEAGGVVEREPAEP